VHEQWSQLQGAQHTSTAARNTTRTLGTRVSASAARAAMLSASSTLPPSFSSSASTYTIQDALPGMTHRAFRSRAPPVQQHKQQQQAATPQRECDATCLHSHRAAQHAAPRRAAAASSPSSPLTSCR
jgi:hypothetical protein